MGKERPEAEKDSGGRNALEEAWRSARILRMRIAVALFRNLPSDHFQSVRDKFGFVKFEHRRAIV